MSLKMLNHYEFDRLKNCLLYCCRRRTTRTTNYLLVEPRGVNSASTSHIEYMSNLMKSANQVDKSLLYYSEGKIFRQTFVAGFIGGFRGRVAGPRGLRPLWSEKLPKKGHYEPFL